MPLIFATEVDVNCSKHAYFSDLADLVVQDGQYFAQKVEAVAMMQKSDDITRFLFSTFDHVPLFKLLVENCFQRNSQTSRISKAYISFYIGHLYLILQPS